MIEYYKAELEPTWSSSHFSNDSENWTKVGQMQVTSLSTSEKVSLCVKRKPLNFDGSDTYCAVFFDPESYQSTVMGEITIFHVIKRKNHIYCEKYGDEPLNDCDMVTEYGQTKEKVSKIWVDYIEATSNDEYKGIGTGLLQVAIERSFNSGYNGRILLSAEGQSHGFYLKMGLQAKNKDKAKELQKHIETKQQWGAFAMHLPEEVIKNRWMPVIEKNPILYGTQKHLSFSK